MRSPVRLYWWRHGSGALGNFGDELSPTLVSLLANRDVVWAPPDDCDLVAVGSVLEHVVGVRRADPVPVWGAGFIRADSTAEPGLVRAHATRGRLSAERVGGRPALGDPALLSRFLVGRVGARYDVGLVPHYRDAALPIVQRFTDLAPKSSVIEPTQPPGDVLHQLAACEFVLSSSLHGLIAADSLGIPAVWVEMSDRVIGGGFKFRDYLSCFGIDDPVPEQLRDDDDIRRLLRRRGEHREHRPGLDDLVAGLIDSFPID